MQVVKRAWLPLVIVLVVAIGGFTVDRVRGFFASDPILVTPINIEEDSDPYDPKVVTYEIFGPAGASVDINYVDLDSRPQRVDGAVLPWSITLETDAPSAAANIVAQGETDYLGCRVIVDDELREEHVVNGTNVQTFCIVKSA